MQYEWWLFSTVSILDAVIMTLFLGVVAVAVVGGTLDVGNRRVFVLLAAPVIFAVGSLSWSVDIGMTAKSVVVYGAALAVFVVTINLFRRVSKREIVGVVVLLPLILIATAVLSYVPGSILSPEWVSPPSTLSRDGYLLSYWARFSHPFLGLSNSFATILAMLLPLVLAVRKLGLWGRKPWIVAMLTLAGIVATGSRGVILAVLVAYGATFLFRLMCRQSAQKSGMALLFTAVAVAGVFVWVNPVAQEHLAGRFDFGNIAARLSAYSIVFSVLGSHPLGVGSGVPLGTVSNATLASVHNAYIQNLLWFGWVGGVALTIAICSLLFATVGMYTRTVSGNAVKRALGMSVLILLLTNMSQASWEGSEIRVWIYFIIGIGVILTRKVDREVRPSQSGGISYA